MKNDKRSIRSYPEKQILERAIKKRQTVYRELSRKNWFFLYLSGVRSCLKNNNSPPRTPLVPITTIVVVSRFGTFGGVFILDRWLGPCGFGPLVLGSLARDLWFGLCGLGSLTWDLWLGIFGLRSFVWVLELGSLAWNEVFRLASFVWDLCLGTFGLGSLVWVRTFAL